MSSWGKPYLTLHVVWHPAASDSTSVARNLVGHFTRERFPVEDMGVNVFEWSDPPSGQKLPPMVDLDRGEVFVVVVLIGDEIQADAGWTEYVRELARRTQEQKERSRLFPVAMTRNAFSEGLGVQALRWRDWTGTPKSRTRRLVREVTYETSRLLRTVLDERASLAKQMEKVRVFLSHSKHDDVGESVARRIRQWLQDDVQLSVFLDIADVPAGLRPDHVLEEGVRTSVVLAVHSDSFSSREWCQREVLVAKQAGRSVVVANCIEDTDERAFPYLGNVPVVRLNPDGSDKGIERVVGRLLDEVFKDFLWQCRTANLAVENPTVMFHATAPELLTLVNVMNYHRDKSLVVYPDPPLGLQETGVLDGMKPRVRSMSEWISEIRR